MKHYRLCVVLWKLVTCTVFVFGAKSLLSFYFALMDVFDIHLRGRLLCKILMCTKLHNFILRPRWLMINWGLACFGSPSKYFLAILQQAPTYSYLIIVSHASHGVSVKKFKWGEFFHIESEREPCVILHIMCNFMRTVWFYTHCVNLAYSSNFP